KIESFFRKKESLFSLKIQHLECNHNILDKNGPTNPHQKTKKLRAILYSNEHAWLLYSHELELNNLLLHNISWHFLQSLDNILLAVNKSAQSDCISLRYSVKKSLAQPWCQTYNPHSMRVKSLRSTFLEDLGGLRHSLTE